MLEQTHPTSSTRLLMHSFGMASSCQLSQRYLGSPVRRTQCHGKRKSLLSSRNVTSARRCRAQQHQRGPMGYQGAASEKFQSTPPRGG